jgi:hypothetical protein
MIQYPLHRPKTLYFSMHVLCKRAEGKMRGWLCFGAVNSYVL